MRDPACQRRVNLESDVFRDGTSPFRWRQRHRRRRQRAVWVPAEPRTGPVELGRAGARCCRAGGWSPAATTTGGYGRFRAARPALCSHAPRTGSLLPFHIWSSPLHRPRSGRHFMLGGTPNDPEHAWSPATCGVTQCSNRCERPQVRVERRPGRRTAFSSQIRPILGRSALRQSPVIRRSLCPW